MNLEISNQENNLPTFYTGCSNSSFSNSFESYYPNALPELSPQDFANLKNSLTVVFSNKNFSATATSVRRTLLPTPVNFPAESVSANAHSIKTTEFNKFMETNMQENKATPVRPIISYTKNNIRKAKRLFNEVDNEYDIGKIKPGHQQGKSEDTLLSTSSSLNNSTSTSSGYNSRLSNKSYYDHNRNSQDHWIDKDKSSIASTSATFTTTPKSNKRKSFSPHPEERHKIFCPLPSPSVRDQVSPSVWDQLSSEIWRLYHRHKQTPDVFNKKMYLRKQLHDALLRTFPRCGLHVVGSSMTGFGTKNSDMDMCLMLTDEEIDQQIVARNLLYDARDALRRCRFIHYVDFIPAKVPILRFRDTVSFIEVDLNLNNTTGIRNTHLLNSYSKMDPRVAPLVLIVKMWAKQHHINDAKHNTLSSYSIALMVLHYLQYGCSPPVVPCLQRIRPDIYHPRSNVHSLMLNNTLPDFKSKNDKSIGELFLGFLDYFTNKFDYENHVMSIRIGGIISRDQAMNVLSPKNKVAHWKRICIEEPFDLTNTACSVIRDENFFCINSIFMHCWNVLKEKKRLQDIFNVNL